MKKIFAVMFAVLFLTTSAWATCQGTNCLQTVDQYAVANPFFSADGGPGPGNGGGWGVTSMGHVTTNSYAQGTKSADALALATGTGIGDGFFGRYQSPTFGVAASGAAGTISVAGAGAAVGKDRVWDTPDYAQVHVSYSGFTGQGNGFGIYNGNGTGVNGLNKSSAQFDGGSFDSSFGTYRGWEYGVPAVAAHADGASGYATGYTKGGYVAGPNFSAAAGVTSGESGHNGDVGAVHGFGEINHQTFASNPSGANGGTWGTSAYCYEGKDYGTGIAKTGGMTVIGNGANFNTVTSISAGSSNAFSSGSPAFPSTLK